MQSQHEADNTVFYSEVQFFFQATIYDNTQTLALVCDYSPPDLDLLCQSYKTLWMCRYQGAEGIRVVNAKNIHSVVAMVLCPFDQAKFFVGEKIGLEVTTLGGVEEEDVVI